MVDRKFPKVSFAARAADGTFCVVEAYTDVPLPYTTVETLLTDVTPPKIPILPFLQAALVAMPQDIPEISMPHAAALTGLFMILDFQNYQPHPDDIEFTSDDDDDEGDDDLIGVLP